VEGGWALMKLFLEKLLQRLLALEVMVWLILVPFMLLGGYALLRKPEPQVPLRFLEQLQPGTRQLVYVEVPYAESVQGSLWLLRRESATLPWQSQRGPVAVTIGHKGLAWGRGEHTGEPPVGCRMKQEGDKCSPAGIFKLPFAFGQSESAPSLRLPYTHLSPSMVGVDDPQSRYYNQVVDSSKVERDWSSNEAMARHGRLYQWGAFIGHNPQSVPGGGSCIFLHLWPGPGRGTAGCTAMAEQDIRQVLEWLDPAQEPRLVQAVAGW
jgi:L,D-peptidoglycan transpeptidase YkuD (ErfK/YbiS/YcfS/YnhG family)